MRFKKRLGLLFVPHKNNHYRPHLVRRYGLLVVIGVAIGLQFGYNYTQTGSVMGRVATVTPAALLASTNDERQARDLPPLRVSEQLSRAADDKARDMLAKGYWGHVSPDGVEPWAWVDKEGYSYFKAGENLAKNFSTASATVGAWMNSEGHRQNVLEADYRDVGFAVAYGKLDDEPVTIVVALYGQPAETAIAGTSVTAKALSEPDSGSLSLASRAGIALQSLTPAAITSIALLFVAATVAITAHIYRQKLPKKLRHTWYRQHGVIKASGLFTVAAFIVMLYGGGQL